MCVEGRQAGLTDAVFQGESPEEMARVFESKERDMCIGNWMSRVYMLLYTEV